MKIVVVTPVWKRPNLSTFCLKQWRDWNVPGLEVEIVIVGSEGETSERLHDQFGHYVEHENLPLGRKFNAGVQYTRDLSYDYLMIMGSDQIVSGSIFGAYVQKMRRSTREPQYLGVLDLCVLDAKTAELKYWRGYTDHRAGRPIGPGRLIRRDLLEELDFVLYDDVLNRNLDASMDGRFPEPLCITGGEHGMTSIKTDESITPASLYKGCVDIQLKPFLAAHFPAEDFSKILNVYV